MPAARVTLVCTTVLGAAQRARIDEARGSLHPRLVSNALGDRRLRANTDARTHTRRRVEAQHAAVGRSSTVVGTYVRDPRRTPAGAGTRQRAGPARGARRRRPSENEPRAMQQGSPNYRSGLQMHVPRLKLEN
eukprot:COSAG02_NODE_760_length_17479_cov_23.555178_13_plen_133_part_00